jgi:hypothetical protein
MKNVIENSAIDRFIIYFIYIKIKIYLKIQINIFLKIMIKLFGW